MNKIKKMAGDVTNGPYREESLGPPLLTLVVLLASIATPLVLAVLRIEANGKKGADITKYHALVQQVGSNVRSIDRLLASEAAGMTAIAEARKNPKVQLIVPDVVIVDEQESPNGNRLNVGMKGIYWHPVNPLVDIGDKTYRVGDVYEKHTIVKITRRTVHFEDRFGNIVVKDFYENLLESEE